MLFELDIDIQLVRVFEFNVRVSELNVKVVFCLHFNIALFC
jgi:hypothetical protein